MDPITLNRTEQDLEFDKVKRLVAEYCFSDGGRSWCLQLTPSVEMTAMQQELLAVNEYVLSFEQIAIPGVQAEEVQIEIGRLKINNAVLESESLMKINSLCKGINHLIQFLQKQEEFYPTLKSRLAHIEVDPTVSELIESILTPQGEVRSSASPELASIRRKMGTIRKEIERNFSSDLAKYRDAGMLDDTKETYINGRRVLAVPAEFKRRVKGTLFGTSNSGKLAYIEPSSNAILNNDLAYLIQEEKNEIYRILQELCRELRVHVDLIQAWQYALIDWDTIQARARFAKQIGACLPELVNAPMFELKEAYHPLLLLENKASKATTLPQSIRLSEQKRIMVISGPNAGGKSITLKTVGLLQWMLQSGLLIPVQSDSKLGVFKQILTDIGDNQSIENKLSTYSYRLQNMRHFLELADHETLFLIDEFGTGSDPELGGALAEVFFEELYHRDSIGVITTHYANIKILADRMKHTVNASMLFDRDTLQPLFKLSVGQPGSSFTFEVAQKNDIPVHLIEEAKKRVKSGKLKLDQSIASLHKERERWTKKLAELKADKEKANKKADDFDFRREEYEFKIMRLQQTQREHNDSINYGKKLQELVNQYNGKNLKKVVANFVKFVKIEFTKKQAAEKPKQDKLAPIQKQREKLNSLQKPRATKPERPLAVGDKVVIDQGEEVGVIDAMKGKTATVIFGNLKTSVAIKRLHIPAKKKK